MKSGTVDSWQNDTLLFEKLFSGILYMKFRFSNQFSGSSTSAETIENRDAS